MRMAKGLALSQTAAHRRQTDSSAERQCRRAERVGDIMLAEIVQVNRASLAARVQRESHALGHRAERNDCARSWPRLP